MAGGEEEKDEEGGGEAEEAEETSQDGAPGRFAQIRQSSSYGHVFDEEESPQTEEWMVMAGES